ncbi:hypothetical protein DVH24_014401 [Malus domestica]|uniref:Uncharacterized protein n=1 Tax=Malus domestica TaxID=3750 RepID=A0A498IUJ5_MALDO|nr:hypothetical protein DVH24_014401 [Malus domestica]
MIHEKLGFVVSFDCRWSSKPTNPSISVSHFHAPFGDLIFESDELLILEALRDSSTNLSHIGQIIEYQGSSPNNH